MLWAHPVMTVTQSGLGLLVSGSSAQLPRALNRLPESLVTSSPIRLWFTAPELGHPLIDDNHDRPLHSRVGPFLREYLSRHEDMDDEDDEMGHLYTSLGDTRVLAHTMLED